MSLVNLSLDEIIARRKRTDKKTNGSVSRFRNIKKKKEYAPEYTATNLAFTRPEASLLDVPSGKWDHSGFEEMYGHGSGDGPLPAPERSGKFNRVDLARKVRLHITNLAPTVNSADLNIVMWWCGLKLRSLCDNLTQYQSLRNMTHTSFLGHLVEWFDFVTSFGICCLELYEALFDELDMELFEEYSIHSATVNYNEMGESVGTADVVTDRITAREIIANLDGVALDGEVMAFHMIDDQAVPINRNVRIKDRLSFREYSRGITKKRLPKRTFTETNNRRKNRSKRLQMTDEELDRELEEYMNKRGQKQNEQKMEI